MKYHIFCICLMIALACKPEPLTPTCNRIELDSLNYHYFDLTPQNVYREICKHDIKFSLTVLAQACLESGWFKSDNCVKRNGLFGMKGGKKTKDNPQGYMVYKNWVYSVRGYLRWQRRHWDGEQDYYKFLENSNYFESQNNYIDKVKSIEGKFIIIKK